MRLQSTLEHKRFVPSSNVRLCVTDKEMHAHWITKSQEEVQVNTPNLVHCQFYRNSLKKKKNKIKRSHLFISEANFHLYRLNFFLASCTTINSVEYLKRLHIGDAFPYILTTHASCSCCSRSDPGSPTASPQPGGDPSPSLSFSFTIYKTPSEELEGFMYFSVSQSLEKAP